MAATCRIGRWRGTTKHSAATAGRPGGGQAVSDELENSRIRPMLVARSALSGVAGNQSGHPIRTLFACCQARRHCSRAVPLVSGTSATRCASTRIVRPSVANRGVSLGYPAVCLIRAPVVSAGMLLKRPPLAGAPVDSAGVMLGPTRWALPDDLHGGEAMSGLQIPASAVIGAHCIRLRNRCEAHRV